MAIFDTITKTQAQTHPMDFVNYCLDVDSSDIAFIELITPEQPTIETHQADVVIKARLEGKEVLVHFEFQTTDSYDPEMSLRMAGYIIRLLETHRLPVYSHVIYLRPDAGRTDTGCYEQQIAGHQVFVEYRVFRLIEMDGTQVLDARAAGLLPFTPLMKRPTGVDAEEWLRRCVRAADSIEVPDKTEYLACLAVLGNLAYEPQTVLSIISEETMQESTLIQYITEKATAEARQQGVKTRALEDILEVIAFRLGAQAAQRFKSALYTIDDPQHLKHLLRAALAAENPEDFQQALDSSNSET